MGYYYNSLLKYRENNKKEVPLQQRMEDAKKRVETDLEQRLSLLRQDYFANAEIDPNNPDRNLAEQVNQAQRAWSQTVLKSTDKFFNDLVKQEAKGLHEHYDSCKDSYIDTKVKIEEIEEGEGIAGYVGKIFGGVKASFIENLSETLEQKQDDLNAVYNAAEDFKNISHQERIEFVVGRYEETGSFEYNPEDIIKFYAQNQGSEQTGNCETIQEQ